MGGGPSHIDTFDPKPDAPTDIRGAFGAIPTNVSGIQISEHLPKLAKQMDKFSIIRSVTSPDGTHETATHYLLSGYPFTPRQVSSIRDMGSVVAREKGFQNGLPPYVMVGGMPNNHGGGGYMGAVYNLFITLAAILTALRISACRMYRPPITASTHCGLDRRRMLRGALDDWQRDKETASKATETMDAFYSRAYDLVTSAGR